MRHTNQHLLIDADDTLWENHGYFLDAIASYFDLLEERGQPRDVTAACLERIERVRTKKHGYGSRLFVQSLGLAYEELVGPLSAADRDLLTRFGDTIFAHPTDPFPGVTETLADLGERHVLWLVTKGQPDEQLAKLERSGLRDLFRAAHVLREKDAATYAALIDEGSLDVTRTWMVGNAPKSDIMAAAAAGLRTVFIPHRTTWFMEDVVIDPPPELRLERFSELTEHF